MSEQTKNTLISFGSLITGQDNKGRAKTTVYANAENARIMAEELIKGADANPEGVRISFHTGKTGNQQYPTTFGFVSPKQSKSGFGKTSFTAKPAATTADRIAATKANLNSKQVG